MKRIIKPGSSEILFWILHGSIGFVHNSLFPLEVALVEKLFALLDPPLASQLRTQFKCYNHFWRGGEWRPFEMRRMIRMQVSFPSDLKIETGKTDVRIASLKFTTGAGTTSNSAVFHLINGLFFSVKFGESYKPIRFEHSIEVTKFRPNRELARMVAAARGGYAASQNDGGLQ